MVVGHVEDAVGVGRTREQDDGPRRLVNRREFHLCVEHRIGECSQHAVGPDAPHRRVGIEIGLELTVFRTRRKVSGTHDLAVQGAGGDVLQHEPLGQILGVDVLVVGVLSNPEHLLGERLGRRSHGHASDTFGRYLNQACSGLFAEIDQILYAAIVDFLDVVALGEVLDVGRAVDDQVERSLGRQQCVERISLGDVAFDHTDALAELFAVFLVEIVSEHFRQALFCLEGFPLTAEQAPDHRLFRGMVYQFAQHMDAQESRGAGQQDVVAERLGLSGCHRLQCVG